MEANSFFIAMFKTVKRIKARSRSFLDTMRDDDRLEPNGFVNNLRNKSFFLSEAMKNMKKSSWIS